MMKSREKLCYIFLLLINSGLYGQQETHFPLQQRGFSISKPLQPQSQLILQHPGHFYNFLLTRDGQTFVNDIDLTEVLNVIVEFKEPALFLQQRSHSPAAAFTPIFIERFRQFADDLQGTQQLLPSAFRELLVKPQIGRKFYKAFFGASLKVSRLALQQIHHLPYIKRIHWDNKVEAFLDESVPLIRADSVWHQYGTQGDSVVVGILDTGIDYRHPALGGGFGPGFKVIGGYDIINRDADPMDDNGHGTFVAGIVAAEGDSIKGVAPKALLMGFKVLDQNGYGQQSQVIAGIERAVDPNDDNDFSDKVDVANISLGGLGQPDDAVSTAVDNAVKLGVTFCISAGNVGNFRSISSPGTARLAITAGASDKQDRIADFSSKAPNAKIYSIKPEVVAPGVNIRSLALQAGSHQANGTSFATPHVAGVCALLKAIHHNWSPAQIKSALITSAIDLGEEVMVQGAGRIDALNAAQTGVFAIPAHLSYGLDSAGETIWTKVDTVLIINHSSLQQSFDIAIDGLQSGIQLQAAPANFSLAHGDTQRVTMTLNVMNNVVPYPQEGSFTYAGTVHLNGSKDRLQLPWAFVKAAKVVLTFDQPLAEFVISNDKNVFFNSILRPEVQMIDPYTFEFIAPKGHYDLLTMFLSNEIKVVVKEKLDIAGYINLLVNSTEATHRVILEGVDESGRLLSSLKNAQKNYVFVFPDSSRLYLWGLYRFTDQGMFVSDFSSRFLLGTGEFQEDLDSENAIRVVQHQAINGLKENVTLANTPFDFIMQYLKITYPPNSNNRSISFPNAVTGIVPGDAIYIFNVVFDKLTPIRSLTWEGKFYLTPDVSDKYRFSTSGNARDVALDFDNYVGDWVQAGGFKVVGDSLASFFLLRPDTYISPSGGEMSFGGAPIYGVALHENNKWGKSNIAAIINFRGSLNEIRHADAYRARYAIYDEQDRLLIAEDWVKFVPVGVAPGRYRLEVSHQNYFVEGVRGTAKLTTHFDLRQADADPARLTSFKLLDSTGKPTGKVKTNESAKLFVSAADFLRVHDGKWEYRPIIIDSTKLYCRRYGMNSWQKIGLTHLLQDTTFAYLQFAMGRLYSADLSHTTNFDSAAIDLKICVQDQSGNRTEWTLEPAYAVGKFGTPVSVEEEPKENPLVPRAYKLYPSHPNPFTHRGRNSSLIHFDLLRTEQVTLKIYDVLGREVFTLIDKIVEAGKHQIAWNGVGRNHEPLASGVYICKIQTAHFEASTKLLLLRQK
ncbi:S8 family serine peptidase [candidate division KSB1 bacterium]|nr:S8 family serine peptidase [candidate division KSB1 bacterium]